MPIRPRPDPYRAFSFVLELDGKPIAGFSAVSGLDAVVDPVDHRAVTATPPGVRKAPGLHHHANVTLQRGVANRKALFEWQAAGAATRRLATIVLRDESRQPVRRWQVAAAWPSKVEGPTLLAIGNDVAIETLELAHEGVTTDA